MTDLPDPDWINGQVAELRRWRDMRPEVVNPVLPEGVVVTPLAPEGGCPGGLVFTPLAAGGASGGDISGQMKAAAPGEGGAAVILYFHGGGFIVGSPETHRGLAAWIAATSGSKVVSIRYGLAPEHRFPIQAQQAVAALNRQMAEAGAGRIRIMGDSAGGLVALWAWAGLEPQERAQILDLTLFYPGAGPGMPPATENPLHEVQGLGPQSLASYYRHLDPGGIIAGDPARDPLAPGFAIPPSLTILGAGADPLLRDSEALAARLGARFLLAGGFDHGFLAGVPAPTALAELRRATGGA